MNRLALDHYRKGVKAIENKDCEQARRYLQQALRLDPKAKLVTHATKPVDYNPKQKLRKLKRICRNSLATSPKKTVASTSSVPKQPSPLFVHISSPNKTVIQVPFSTKKLTIRGRVEGGKLPYTLLSDNGFVPINVAGDFQFSQKLVMGRNNVRIVVQDADGQKKTAHWNISRMVPKAVLPLFLHTKRRILSKKKRVKIFGKASGGTTPLTLSSGNQHPILKKDGSFSFWVSNDQKNKDHIIVVKDQRGVILKKVITVGLIQELSIKFNHKDTIEIGSALAVKISGLVEGGQSKRLLVIDKKPVALHAKGRFAFSVKIADGQKEIKVRVQDASGQSLVKVIRVIRGSTAITLTLDQPTNKSKTKLPSTKVSGQVQGGRGKITLLVHGKVTTPKKGRYYADVPLDFGDNIITVLAKDQGGKEKEIQVQVYRELILQITGKGNKANELITKGVGRSGFKMLGTYVERSGVPRSNNIRLVGYTRTGTSQTIGQILHVSIQKSKLIFTLSRHITSSDLKKFKAVTLK